MSSADELYEPQSSVSAGDNDYTSRPGQKQEPIAVQSDTVHVEESNTTTADSDEQLARDDSDAIDESNVIDQRTRHAKPSGGYREPGDDEGLPGPEDGTSVGSQ